jgi:Glycosyl transferase family 2
MQSRPIKEILREIYINIYNQPDRLSCSQVENQKGLQDESISISYILSTYHNPDALCCALYWLKAQTQSDIEVIVADNSTDPIMVGRNESAVKRLNDRRFRYYNTRMFDCYASAEFAVQRARGEFLCFPSDDSYYVPMFGEVLLKAARQHNLDLVYCNMVMDPRYYNIHWVLDVGPRIAQIDKSGFLLRKSKFVVFPGDIVSRIYADGALIEELVRQGVRHGKVKDILAFHD